jgi:hypothetical protein
MSKAGFVVAAIALVAASPRAQLKSGCCACDKTTRRANHQKSVQPSSKKYSAFADESGQEF